MKLVALWMKHHILCLTKTRLCPTNTMRIECQLADFCLDYCHHHSLLSHNRYLYKHYHRQMLLQNLNHHLLCQVYQIPDITGEFASCDNGDREYPTGAFYDFWDFGNTIAVGRGCEDLRFGMKASNSNAIYLNSTVQPPAIQTLTIIKT